MLMIDGDRFSTTLRIDSTSDRSMEFGDRTLISES